MSLKFYVFLFAYLVFFVSLLILSSPACAYDDFYQRQETQRLHDESMRQRRLQHEQLMRELQRQEQLQRQQQMLYEEQMRRQQSAQERARQQRQREYYPFNPPF